MEKFLNIFAPVFVIALLVFMLISGHYYAPSGGIFHNFYAQNCAHKAWYWKVLGDGLFLGAVYMFWRMAADDSEYSLGAMLGLGVLVALSFCALAGFTFPYA